MKVNTASPIAAFMAPTIFDPFFTPFGKLKRKRRIGEAMRHSTGESATGE